MNSITQDMRYRLSLMQCSLKHGVTVVVNKKVSKVDTLIMPVTPFTPRHNGKVERSHRKDNERFYAVYKFHSFEVFKK